MNSEARMVGVFACSGLTVLSGVQTHILYAPLISVIFLLVAAFLLWQELQARHATMQRAAETTANALADLAKSAREQRDSMEKWTGTFQRQMEDRWEREEAQQAQLMEAISQVRVATEKLGQTVASESTLTGVSAKLVAAQEDMAAGLQTTQAQALKDLQAMQERTTSAFAASQDKAMQGLRTAQEKGVANLSKVTSDQVHAMTAMKKELLMELHTMEDAAKPLQAFFQPAVEEEQLDVRSVAEKLDELNEWIHFVESDMRPLSQFLQGAHENNVDAQSFMESLDRLSRSQRDLPEVMRDTMREILDAMQEQADAAQDALGGFEKVPDHIESVVQRFQEKNEGILTMQKELIDAMKNVIEQGKSLSAQDTELLHQILQRK